MTIRLPVAGLHRILLALFLCGIAAPAWTQSLRVMTFNVRLPVAADGENRWEARRELTADTIRRYRPDLIGTQELHKPQGDFLIERLNGYAWFGRDRRGGESDEHVGVFYRTKALRVVESGDFWLSDTPGVPGSITWGNLYPRLTTWALFEHRSSHRRFYVYNTHLPYRDEDEAARIRCAELILAHLARQPQDEAAEMPVIVMGDFNTSPDSRVHTLLSAQLRDAWLEAPEHRGPAATFHGFTGRADRRIDWIFARGLRARRAVTVIDARDGRYPSDHFPVFVDFRWPRKRVLERQP
jgi:endonuclease/exonuclease/phosphatase family metal-dependent hydrolase